MSFINPPQAVNIIADIVQKMNDDLLVQFQQLDSNIQRINYQHGHPLEIIETLIQDTQSKTGRYAKYPLVFLVEDIEESRGGSVSNYRYAELDLTLYLIQQSKKEYKAAERYANVFEPYLLPMYASFLNNLAFSPHFEIPDVNAIEHKKINRLYWGREELGGNRANMLSDFVDAIEIKNLRIIQDRWYCTNPISLTN